MFQDIEDISNYFIEMVFNSIFHQRILVQRLLRTETLIAWVLSCFTLELWERESRTVTVFNKMVELELLPKKNCRLSTVASVFHVFMLKPATFKTVKIVIRL